MAKGKKTAELSLEERLEAALVPNWEQPYIVPENWCWVRLGNISYRISDGSHNPPKDSGKGVPLLSATNIHDRMIDFEQTARWITNKEWVLENERTQIDVGDVLLTIVATIGRVAVVSTEQPFALQRSVATIKPKINSLYLSYYLESPYIQTFMKNNAKGTAQKGFYLKALENLFCALPPLSEQRRIVDRINSLFAKLDEAKEKAQAVVDGFEERKAAILHKAFTGVLTEKWREENGVSDDSRYSLPISEVCRSLKYGTAKKSQDSGKVVVIRMGNLQAGEIDWSDLAFSDDEEDIEKYRLDPGDVLFNRTNSAALVGKTSIYRGDYPAIYAGYLIKLDYNHEIMDGEYLNYILNSPEAKTYCNSVKSDGVNQSNINAKKIGAFVIPVPTMKEQFAIVKMLSSILTKEKATKEIAEKTIVNIGEIKKAILSKAFRGELGTNDPEDESAAELLKRIL